MHDQYCTAVTNAGLLANPGSSEHLNELVPEGEARERLHTLSAGKAREVPARIGIDDLTVKMVSVQAIADRADVA